MFSAAQIEHKANRLIYMKKTNVIYYNSTLSKGGTDMYMLEVVRNIDKSKFQVDVIIKDGDNVDKFMFDELTSHGAEVYLAKGSFYKRIMYLRKFFKTHRGKYDVCHINATSQGTGLVSYFAKNAGKIKKVIFHSHMGGNDHGQSIIDKIGTRLMSRYSTHYASCSNVASQFMYGSKFCEKNNIIKLNNSVDTIKFRYDEKLRKKIRKELQIKDKEFVILHVGRFAEQKNHKRLLGIFRAVLDVEQDAKLLLVGAGELFEKMQAYAQELEIDKNTIFLGLKNNVVDYMNVADCFLMPSWHEGLPIVAVEAQANGLPCVLSGNISRETKLTENVVFVELNDNNEIWAKAILESKNDDRLSAEQVLKSQNFDHSTAIKVIEKLYQE